MGRTHEDTDSAARPDTVASIQVNLTDIDAMQFQNDVVSKIVEVEAQGIAIDITSLDVVNSFMARVINETAFMARLLGSEVVICGVQPFVALTLVEMGRDLISAECHLQPRSGIETAARADRRAWGFCPRSRRRRCPPRPCLSRGPCIDSGDIVRARSAARRVAIQIGFGFAEADPPGNRGFRIDAQRRAIRRRRRLQNYRCLR